MTNEATKTKSSTTNSPATRAWDILGGPWAIVPEKLLEIQAAYMRHLNDEKFNASQWLSKNTISPPEKPYDVIDGVAVIPIHGIIAKRMNLLVHFSGGVSTQLLKRDIQAAAADSEVKSIFLDVDSPGGTVDGTEELARTVAETRSIKPIIAFTDGLMASAAYWIAASADQIYISGETSVVGSIGVVTAHVDYSRYEEKIGVKTTEIYAGKYKRIASEYSPLSGEGRSYLQDQVNLLYTIFVDKVMTNRPKKLVLPKSAKDELDEKGVIETTTIPWADGKIFTGAQAVEVGLVDGIVSRELLLEAMAGDANLIIRRALVYEKLRTARRAMGTR